MSKETYFHIDICRNCHRTNSLDIEKGQTIDKALSYIECKNCGVKLRPSEDEMQNNRLKRALGKS